MTSYYLTLLLSRGALSSSSPSTPSSSDKESSISSEEISKSNSLVSLPLLVLSSISTTGEGGRGGGVVSTTAVDWNGIVCGSGLCSRMSGSSSSGCGIPTGGRGLSGGFCSSFGVISGLCCLATDELNSLLTSNRAACGSNAPTLNLWPLWPRSTPAGDFPEYELVLSLGLGDFSLACESNISLKLETLPDTLRGGGRLEARRIGELSLEVTPDLERGVASIWLVAWGEAERVARTRRECRLV